MTLAQAEQWTYYAILGVSALSCLLQSRVVWRLRRDRQAARRSGRSDRAYLAQTTLLSEAAPWCLHFAFFVLLGFPLLIAHWPWLARLLLGDMPRRSAATPATPLPLFIVEAVAAFLIPLLLLGHTYVASRRRQALARLLRRLTLLETDAELEEPES